MVYEYEVSARPGSGNRVEAPAFPPTLYDLVADLDKEDEVWREKWIQAGWRSEISIEVLQIYFSLHSIFLIELFRGATIRLNIRLEF